MESAHSHIMFIMYSLPYRLIVIVVGIHQLVDSFVSLHQENENDENYHNESNYQNNNNNNNDCRERSHDY